MEKFLKEFGKIRTLFKLMSKVPAKRSTTQDHLSNSQVVNSAERRSSEPRRW